MTLAAAHLSNASGAPAGPVICIAGPTASGKSSLAEAVALRLGTDVISVDSMQVYKGMDIGTAKTPVSERRVPLQMVDVADVDQDYSVSMFQRQTRELVDARLACGQVPVLCGGTGLYLDSVIDEMDFPAGQTHGGARERYEAIAREEGVEALWRLLLERDEKSAQEIHPNNVRRVVRALEMLDGGVSYAKIHEGLKQRVSHYDARIWGITMDRARLYERINLRVDLMLEQGLVDEVKGLVARGYGDDLTARQAIGYKEILEYLDGSISLDEAVELIKQRSRRYAKRQLSWLRRDGRVRWLNYDEIGSDEAVELIVADALGASFHSASSPTSCVDVSADLASHAVSSFGRDSLPGFDLAQPGNAASYISSSDDGRVFDGNDVSVTASAHTSVMPEGE